MEDRYPKNPNSGSFVLMVVALLVVMVALGAMPARKVRPPKLNQAATATPTPSKAPPDAPTATATETIPPSTPLATLTPSYTLKPPPTFEPPTNTVMPTDTPTVTPSSTIDYSISVEGLHGLETATPSSTPGCAPREDWQLRYTIQAFDTLTKIAGMYNITIKELQEGNCLTDADTIIIGQELRVPGEVQPVPTFDCGVWEVLQPYDGMVSVDAEDRLTLNWIGPRAQLNLIRITKPDGVVEEEMVELQQNASVDLTDEKYHQGGWYTWQVFPLDGNFVQIACHESPAWRFKKEEYDEEEDDGGPAFEGVDIQSLIPLLTAVAP